MDIMTGADCGSENLSRAVLQEYLESQWYLLGKKFIAHALVTEGMTMRDGEYAEVRLVEAFKDRGRALVMLDIAAMAEMDGGFKCLIQKIESLNPMSPDDIVKLAKIKKIREQILYCRQSSLKE